MVVVTSLLAAILVSSISQAGAYNQVSISVPVSGMPPAKVQQVAGNQAVINIGDSPQGGSPGDPMLPFKSVCLLVPPDADLEAVSAGLVSPSWEDLAGEYDIAPANPAAAWDGEKFIISWGDKDESVIVGGRDSTIYNKNAYFPSEPVQIVSVGSFRQWKLVELRVWLAVYNPVQKKVRTLKDAQTTLSVPKLPAAEAVGLNAAVLPAIPKTGKFLPELRSKIANPQDIDTFYVQQAAPAAGSGGPAPLNAWADYVIITTSTIQSNSTKLANFIAAKTAAGFTVNTVTEANAAGDSRYIEGTDCDTRANNIRAWLKNHYLADGIEYVLLIGDPDPGLFTANMSVPMKWCWPRNGAAGPVDEIQCPSDMFFAELSGNWDLDGDGKYGEYNGDYGGAGADKNCELKVGRIPVYNADCVDLDSILQKCIDYDTAAGNKAWRSKVLIPAAVSNFGPQDNTGDGVADAPFENASKRTFGADWGEAIKSLASSISFSAYTLYEKTGIYADGSAYPLTACNANLNNANFINEWKNQYGFVTWWAHGAQTSASRFTWTSDSAFVNICGNHINHNETSWSTLVSQFDCASLDNNTPSFVVQVSCNNAWPELLNNLGYDLLKQGAIGTISGTRITWYAIGAWNTGNGANVGDNASYGYYCFDRMGNVGEDIGTALVWCRSNFGTGWASQSWMNMIEFSLYGDPSLSLDLPAGGLKWQQPPDTSDKGMDIRFDRSDGINRTLADDFLCTSTGPITKVTLWGSWRGDVRCAIKKIHLSIHNDKPDPDGPDPGYSEPNTLLWSKDFYTADISETIYYPLGNEWWWDPYTMATAIFPGDTQIWQYDIDIPSSDAFVQLGDPCSPIVYWLDAYAELDPCDPDFPDAMFGWKTSAQHWNDDGVWRDEPFSLWHELRYPSGHPSYYDSIDLAFALRTGVSEVNEVQPHLKWSQPPIEIDPEAADITYCGWDEKSFNKDYYDPCGPWKIVADDFRCLGTMPITSIHWWGSFFDWEQGGWPHPQNLPVSWRIGFWSNVPAYAPPDNLPYSYPEVLLHVFTVPAARVTMTQVAQDQYYGEYPNDTCYRYSLDLEPNEVFWQNDFNDATQDNIFWLSITAVYNLEQYPYHPWGWKSRPWHWMDDSVTFNLPIEPMPDYVLDPCGVTPIKDPVFNESFDMSFELDTDPNYIKWEQPFTGIRNWAHYEDVNSLFNFSEPNDETLVADDWRCLRRTPVTAIVWFGSYIGYGYEACSYPPFMPLPVKPNRFLLKIWTDVPADPCDPNSYSHPKDPIWQYVASSYDEVFVGYDKYPLGEPNEPVFRYSVRLPDANWFHQPDFNEVFWLSVQAVYDTNLPNYQWGWTNHEHAFNDDAVKGNKDPTTGQWQWQEVFDQEDNSADMSFILFTDPNECSTCPNYNCDSIVNFKDYSDFADNWLASVPPGGYDNSDLNCDGTIDWSDLGIFAQKWLSSCP